ncbi:hypothetical protein IJV79_01525, partial [bacterium]|nr:hypothetical protein [bacterium]
MSIFSEKIPTLRQEEFKQKILSAFDARVNPKQYAFWEIRHPDFVATFYNSSKFVVQGRNITPVLDALQLSTETCTDEQEYEVITVPHIGTDESGKGDFFGPLVTAGVFVDEKNRKLFEELGIRDSKTLRDDQILK